MTKQDLASILNGREIGNEITKAEAKQAKDAGLVVIYGGSDDLMEFKGAIDDEIGAYDGTKAKVHRGGVLEQHNDCDCEFCGYKKLAKQCATIEAVWEEGFKGGYYGHHSWTYKTDIPHATFEIVEDGEKYCRGIVISLADLPEVVK